tara:strand:- start:1064 stop:1297 length:234 start_codon:yes stop_codon:yes gene_type:complete
MKIINGKWVDDNDNPVNNFNVSELLEIGRKVKVMYGKNITYDRIALVSYIRKLTRTEEEDLTYVLSQDGVLSKLAGY